MKDRFEEFKESAQPLVNFLNKYYDPHTRAIVDTSHAELLSGEMGVPFEVKG